MTRFGRSGPTPENLVLLPAAGIRGVGRAAGLLFGAGQLADVPAALRETVAPGKTLQERIESGGRGLTDILFGAAGVGHGTGLTDRLFPANRATEPEIARAVQEIRNPKSEIRNTEGVIPNAVQEPSAGEILQRQPQETGTPGSERGGVEPGQQGQEAAQASAKEVAPAVEPGFVRLYHGSSDASPQAGRDFTPFQSYAQGYADKAVGGGKVWYVDVPEGSLKTHDEYGQPMSRVIVPDEIADKAKPLMAEAASPEQPSAADTAAATEEGSALPETTGISQAANEARGSDVVPGEGASPEEMIDRGRQLMKDGADPEPIATKIDKGEAITADETAVLRAHVENLAREANRAQDAADADPSNVELKQAATDAFKAETDFRKRIKPAATEWQKVGATMQGATDIDTGSFTGLRRAVMEEKGRDVTPKEEVKLRETAKTVQDATTAEAAAKAKFDEAIAKAGKKESRFKTVEDLKAHLAERVREMTPC